jgi:hypothetical protein
MYVCMYVCMCVCVCVRVSAFGAGLVPTTSALGLDPLRAVAAGRRAGGVDLHCASAAQAFRTLWVDTSGLTQWMLSEEEMLAMADAINLFK